MSTSRSLVASSVTSQDESYHISFADEEAVRAHHLQSIRDEVQGRISSYRPYSGTLSAATDKINERFTIHADQPLPELSHGNMQAFAASDDTNPQRMVYAVVCHPAYPYRQDIFKNIRMEHPNMLKFYDSGTAKISSLNDQRQVFIYERPRGKRLSELLERHQTFPEEVVIHQILRPIASVIALLAERKLCHGHIHPNNIFIGDRTMIGECVSEPCGYSQEYLYEAPERIVALPEGKGTGGAHTDAYALTILAIDLLSNLEGFRQMGSGKFISLLMSMGAYNLFTTNRSLPDGISDLVKGALCDNPWDRWGAQQLEQWATGKRFNIVQPNNFHDASRPYEFDGQEYINGRALAHAMFQKWHAARNMVRTPALARWIEQNMHKKEIAIKQRRAIETTGGDQNTSGKSNNELLARTILLLDPFGPIRTFNLAFHIDGIGGLLCECMRNNRHADITQIMEVLANDLPNFAADLQTSSGGEDAFDVLWKLDKIRHRVKSTSVGFGLERAIYDLNPNLPCLSQKLKEYQAEDISQLLHALDIIAPQEAFSTSLYDAHITAYAASHANISKEMNFAELSRFSYFKENKEFATFAILGKAQEKARIKHLYGLSHWVAMRIMENMSQIHSLKIRRSLSQDILNAAEKGNINAVLSAFANKAMLEKDLIGFKQAMQLFHMNNLRIHKLRSYEHKRRQASELGGSIAGLFSLIILLATLYFVLKEYLVF